MNEKVELDDTIFRLALYKAHKGKCFWTDRDILFEDMSVDHIIPQEIGGKNILENLVPTTQSINSAKGTKIDEEKVKNIVYFNLIRFVPKVKRFMVELVDGEEWKEIKKEKSRKSILQRKYKLLNELEVDDKEISYISKGLNYNNLIKVLNKRINLEWIVKGINIEGNNKISLTYVHKIEINNQIKDYQKRLPLLDGRDKKKIEKHIELLKYKITEIDRKLEIQGKIRSVKNLNQYRTKRKKEAIQKQSQEKELQNEMHETLISLFSSFSTKFCI